MDFGPILRAMGRNKVRFGLIVVEIALTLAIVANCINMIGDARRTMARPSGFDDDNLISVRSTPFQPDFKDEGYRDNSARQDAEILRALPGVRAVSNTRFLPWQGGGSSTEVRIHGDKGAMHRLQQYNADEATLDTLGTHLVEGRNFTREDVERDTARLRLTNNSERKRNSDGLVLEPFSQDILISKAFADLLFKDGKALGRILEDQDGDIYPVIGILDKFYNPYGWPIHEYVMFYAARAVSYNGVPYLVRTEPGQVPNVLPVIEKALLSANGGRNVKARPLQEIKETYLGPQALTIRLLSIVIVLLLFVTGLGIVGLTSFSVSERTRQIGTRRALGASKGDILRYFLLENWIVTTLGLTLGIFLAVGLNMALTRVADAARLDLSLIVKGVLLLWIAGFLATYFPALRGTRVAPAVATRNV